MKKFLIIPTLIIAALFFTSCEGRKRGDSFTFGTYATVYRAVDQECGIAFKNDYGQKFYVKNNKTDEDLSTLEINDRKVINITAVESNLANYDFSVTLNDIYDVDMGNCMTIINEEESDKILDMPLTHISDIILGQNFLNIYTAFKSNDIENAEYYLIDYKEAELNEDIDDDYIYLEFRVATTSDSDDDKVYTKFISIDLIPFYDLLYEKKGIVLRVNTESKDVITYEISSSSIFDED